MFIQIIVVVNFCFAASSHWAPEFLEPVILEVVLAGKSMEMLQDLGKLADVCGGMSFRDQNGRYPTILDQMFEGILV